MIARLHMLDGCEDAAAEVPALQHFRLVRESPSPIEETGRYRYVKVFEYVDGATIHGTGNVSVNITTNSGRTFTYKQSSSTGVFVVPYIGEYTDAIGKHIYVNESDVLNGVEIP
jgi:asparagine N-glycosylation enzyme membrane subunit Stt3